MVSHPLQLFLYHYITLFLFTQYFQANNIMETEDIFCTPVFDLYNRVNSVVIHFAEVCSIMSKYNYVILFQYK